MSRPAKWFIETLSPADAALLPPNLRLPTLTHVDLTAKQATPLARVYGLKAIPSYCSDAGRPLSCPRPGDTGGLD